MRWRGTFCYMLSILGMLLAQPASSAIYRWVDRQGQVHYGDQPDRSQAVQIEVVDPQSFTLPAIQNQQAQGTDADKKTKQEKPPPVLSILSPKPGAELTTGTISVRFSVKPPLAPGEGTITAFLDGAEVAKPRGTAFSVEVLQEGAHELQLRVLDPQGKQIAQTAVLINAKSPWSKAGSSNFELLKKMPPPAQPQATPRLTLPAHSP